MLKFLLGLFLGANLSLFLYACIFVGSRFEKEDYNERSEKVEWRKQY